jgi:hypothetical protein
MQSVAGPESLLKLCRRFVEDDAVGFLLSGGCDKNGRMLKLRRMLPAVKKIKKETDLVIKLHTGLVDKELATDIVDAGVDIASVEVVGSNATLKEIFGVNASVDSYISTLQNLESAGMPFIVPHVCIGLHYGELKGEFYALEVIKNSCVPSSLVMIIFRPTRGTVLEKCKVPSTRDISRVIRKAKEMFPDKDVSLGCMRPRHSRFRENIELVALESGVTRMEIPSRKTLEYARRKGYIIKSIDACCALPVELEEKALRR